MIGLKHKIILIINDSDMHGWFTGTGCDTNGSNRRYHWDKRPHYSTDVHPRLNSSNFQLPSCGHSLLCCCHRAAHRAFRSISKFWTRIIHQPGSSRWQHGDKQDAHFSNHIKISFTTHMWLLQSTAAAASDGPDLLHSQLNVQQWEWFLKLFS